ncbi:hypothetical protein BD311DRAFT_777578 [Dichomitus squalens]|uniref:Uncharacterized protein n=1 Tax=Dichomitus squalens TaxID=114155 RepID=A0A4Q9MSC4_9APHY|nr:hypothetical protein BD311DRAFT_777578 [Dichomitus squalens]
MNPRATRSISTSSNLVRRASISQSSEGAIIGIVVGVTAFFLLLLAMVQYRELKAFFERIVMRIRRCGLDTPAKDRVWDVLSTQETGAMTSTAGSTADSFMTRESRMRDMSSYLVSTREALPPLQPNRRPPSMFDPALVVSSPQPPPPLPRLEPLRRKPSTTLAALTVPSRESSPPPPIPPKEPELEKRIATTLPTLAAPKPVLGADLRPSSAYTSASTALSDMTLLKPSTRLRREDEPEKDVRLSRVLTVANPDKGFLPPIPPVPPIPPIYLQPKQEPSPTLTTSPRPLPPKPSLPSSPLAHSPLSEARTRMDSLSPTTPSSTSYYAPSSLRRSNSTGSTRTPPMRKPVPPLIIPGRADFSSFDAASSVWGAGSRKNSLASTAWDDAPAVFSRYGSPVPSSSASQMYRARDSGLSEWTWTRPLEEWEKEQMNIRRKTSAGELTPPLGQRGARKEGSGDSWGRLGHKTSASMGEMRVARGIVPDVPPVPRQYLP